MRRPHAVQPSTLLTLVLGILLVACVSPSYGQRRSTPRVKAPAAPVARVLVALKGDYKLEGTLDKAAVNAQRSAIAAAQARVIAGIKAETRTKSNYRPAARVKRRYVTVPGLALELKPELVKDLERLPDVAAVYEDRLNSPSLSATTKLIGSRLANTDAFGANGRGQVVAVLDSGVDRDHPFLGTSRFVAHACYSTENDVTDTVCPNGSEEQFGANSVTPCNFSADCNHGTHVAGIVGGYIDQDANRPIAVEERKGVAPRVKFIAMQVFSRLDRPGGCRSFNRTAPCLMGYDSDVIAGLDRVELLSEDHDIAAVNLSLGGGRYTSESDCDSENWLMKWAIDDLRSLKIATVAASGNDGFGAALNSPACISSAISVGNTDIDDVVNGSSNTASFLKLLAPGTGVISSVPGTGFDSKTGTSMAAPHVAGLWALMKQRRAEEGESTSVRAILDRLQNTGRAVSPSAPLRIDAMKALNLKAVEISTDAPFDRIDLEDLASATRNVTLKRWNFTDDFTLSHTLEGGSADALTVDFYQASLTGNSGSMDVIPAPFAYGRYTLNVRGTGRGAWVFPKQLTVNVLPPAPTITGFSPASGNLYSWVTITGENFSRLTEVEFRGSGRIRPVVDSSTSMRAQVPVGATSGRLRVYNGARNDVSLDWFFVTPDPVILNVSPNHAPVGAPVVINGVNFNTATTVRINGVPVTGLSATTTQLRFNVPQTASGVHDLRVETNVGDATTNFTVGYPVPTVSGFSPSAAMPGDTLTFYGSGFFAPVGVRICLRASRVTIVSPTRLRVVVPQGVGDTCSVQVLTNGGTVQVNQTFQTSQ